jgi:hypothetical protein
VGAVTLGSCGHISYLAGNEGTDYEPSDLMHSDLMHSDLMHSDLMTVVA